jgi:hypothetical protein
MNKTFRRKANYHHTSSRPYHCLPHTLPGTRDLRIHHRHLSHHRSDRRIIRTTKHYAAVCPRPKLPITKELVPIKHDDITAIANAHSHELFKDFRALPVDNNGEYVTEADFAAVIALAVDAYRQQCTTTHTQNQQNDSRGHSLSHSSANRTSQPFS